MGEPAKLLLRMLFVVMDFAVGSIFFWGTAIAYNRLDGVGNVLLALSALLVGLSLWTSVYLAIVGHRLLAKLRAAVYGLLILAIVVDWARLVLSGGGLMRADTDRIALYGVALFAFGLASSLTWIALGKRSSFNRTQVR